MGESEPKLNKNTGIKSTLWQPGNKDLQRRLMWRERTQKAGNNQNLLHRLSSSGLPTEAKNTFPPRL